jgi:hypothetical protein
MRTWRFGVAMLAGLLVTAALAGCAEERSPIDRVQPNAIKKSMLNGEWFFHQKVVDVPGGMLQGFIIPSVVGWYSDPLRVRFDIQEKFLYVRRVNELVENAEVYTQEYDEEWSSYAMLAAYRIEKHFDIQRDYNPVTGESYNVVSENAMDRPWWEREYMRVDWSVNYTPGFTFDVSFVTQYPAQYYVQDACTPDLEFAADPEDRCVPDSKAPFFDIVWNADGSGLEKGYFDVTTSFIATPETAWLDGYGDIPGCWLFGNDAMECVATMYFVRNSFWLNDREQRDYEPMPYSGAISDQFGFFYSDYLAYDPQYAITEASRRYLIQRYNIWEQSHSWNRVDPETGDSQGIDWTMSGTDLFNPGNRLLCRTTADCCPDFDPSDSTADAKCNSVCDTYTDLRPSDRVSYEEKFACKFRVTPQDLVDECAPTHYCTLPYNERRARPIVYYTNAEWPEEIVRNPWEPKYVPPTEDAPGIWGYEVEHEPDAASLEAWKYAMADEGINETRSAMEKVGDRWNAPFARTINILKRKAAGQYNSDTDANMPSINDDMRRKEGGQGAFAKLAPIPAENGDMRGFDHNWYDADRPAFAMCRFNPVLGPDNDPNNVEPDICWERIQEMSHCVFNPELPGVNPKTGQVWEAARDWPLCTLREASPRLGDVRYSFAYWVDKWYEGFRLLGLGPGHSDLLTGETLCGVGHIYMHNDMAAQRMVDTALLLTGDIDTKKYIDGYNLLEWRNKYTGSGTNPQALSSPYGGGAMAGGAGGYSAADIATQAGWMKASLDRSRKFDLSMDQIMATGNSHMPSHSPAASSGDDLKFPFTADDLMRAAADSYDAMGGYLGDEMIRSIADHPSGGYIEDMLLSATPGQTRTLLSAIGLNPTMAENGNLDESAKDMALVTRRDPFRLMQAQESMQSWLETEFKADFASPVDDTANELAYEIQRLRAAGRLPSPGDAGYTSQGFINSVWRLARKKLLHAVVMHELGHSVGQRHNFAGSQDYINYFEDYWKIRSNGCADANTDWMAPKFNEFPEDMPWNEESGCGNASGGRVGPRFVNWEDGGDPISQYEIYKKIFHYAYSSVMDYAAGYHIDEAGVGRYDWAAMLYGYGHHFEVYKEIPKNGGAPANWKNHATFRPGYVTAAGDATTIRETAVNAAINSAALIPNEEGEIPVIINKTGQRLCVDQSDIGANYIKVTNCKPGEPPCIVDSWNDDGTWECSTTGLDVGDKFSVWGWPLVFNAEAINGYTVKDMLDDYQSSGGNPLVFFFAQFYSPHYTQWYYNWPDLGFNLQSNREVRDIREFDWRVRSQGNSWEPGFNLKDPSETVVRAPYAYCTDNQSNISNDCRTRDMGADDWERMYYHIADWDQWYISRSFVRNRVGYRPDNYAAGYYNRIYRTPKNYNDIYSLYQEIVAPLYTDPRQIDAMMTDPYNSWGGYTMALHDGFNMLWQTIAAPDAMAPYQVKERPQNSEYALDADLVLGFQGNMGFDIGNGGRVFETRYGNYNYDNNCGNSFWRCLWNVGYYYDKVMAIQGLSESSTFFVGRDTAHDVRLYRVSFFDNFNWQLKKYFAALMGEDWGTWAPVVAMSRMSNDTEVLSPTMPLLPAGTKQPKIFWRNWANPTMDITNPWVFLKNTDWGTAVGFDPMEFITQDFGYQFTPIEPVASFTVQVYASVLGMARFQHNYDFSYYNTSRMWQTQGSSIETFSEIVKYYDQENQIVYSGLAEYGVNEVYHPYKTEAETGVGVAAAMIKYANAMKARSTECDPYDIATDTQITPWFEDNCCDNPYNPITTEDTSDDCPAIIGYPPENTYSSEEMLELTEKIDANREAVTGYLKQYKGLLDFQVRLTSVFDQYLGMVGPVYDPGATPGE